MLACYSVWRNMFQPVGVTRCLLATVCRRMFHPVGVTGCLLATEYHQYCALLQKLVSTNVHAVNCRDIDGRNSTPLHFAAGYNRVAIVDYLLENGADVHAKDKGYHLHCIAASYDNPYQFAVSHYSIGLLFLSILVYCFSLYWFTVSHYIRLLFLTTLSVYCFSLLYRFTVSHYSIGLMFLSILVYCFSLYQVTVSHYSIGLLFLTTLSVYCFLQFHLFTVPNLLNLMII